MLYVAKNLKWLMGDKITPYALASETGVPQPTIFRILTGESDDPRTKTLQPLASYFGVTVADLRDKDLASVQGGAAAPREIENLESGVVLDSRQRDWLGLLNHLGSDDIAEFAALIKSRQERNIRFIEELATNFQTGKNKHATKILSSDNFSGKKQRSQSS